MSEVKWILFQTGLR